MSTPLDYWHLYPIFDTSNKKRLKRTSYDVVRETKSANDWPDFPLNAVAIGANGGGDQLMLVPKSDFPNLLNDAVYWWDHETGTIHKVADDFGDLLRDPNIV